MTLYRRIRELFERHPWAAATYLLSAASTLTMIWGWRFLPLQDYPDWVYQGNVFASFLRGQMPPAFSVARVLAPNSVSTLSIGALALVLPAEQAGKVFLSCYALGYLAAGAFLLRATLGTALFLLPALTVWNFSFLHGNVSYAFSLPVLFVGLSYVIRWKEGVRPLGIAVLSVALYVCHGTAYASFALVLLALWACRPSLRLLGRMALGLLPSALLWMAYGATQLHDPIATPYVGADAVSLVSFLELKGETLTRIVALFGSFHPFYEPLREAAPALVLLNKGFLAAVAWLLARACWHRSPDRALVLVAVGLHVVLFLLAPRASAGIVNPGERLVLPMMFLLAACAYAARPEPWFTRLFAVAAVVQAGFLLGYGSFAAERLARFHQALSRHTRSARFALLHESHLRPAPREQGAVPRGWARLPRHHPLLRQNLLVELERGAPAPIFETGLLRYRGPETIVTSLEDLHRLEPIDAVAIVGDDHGVGELAADLDEQYDVVERGDGFVILLRTAISSI